MRAEAASCSRGGGGPWSRTLWPSHHHATGSHKAHVQAKDLLEPPCPAVIPCGSKPCWGWMCYTSCEAQRDPSSALAGARAPTCPDPWTHTAHGKGSPVEQAEQQQVQATQGSALPTGAWEVAGSSILASGSLQPPLPGWPHPWQLHLPRASSKLQHYGAAWAPVMEVWGMGPRHPDRGREEIGRQGRGAGCCGLTGVGPLSQHQVWAGSEGALGSGHGGCGFRELTWRQSWAPMPWALLLAPTMGWERLEFPPNPALVPQPCQGWSLPLPYPPSIPADSPKRDDDSTGAGRGVGLGERGSSLGFCRQTQSSPPQLNRQISGGEGSKSWHFI